MQGSGQTQQLFKNAENVSTSDVKVCIIFSLERIKGKAQKEDEKGTTKAQAVTKDVTPYTA